MKKCIVVLLLLALTLTGCSRISVRIEAGGTVTYSYGGVSFSEELTEAEVRSAASVLDGKPIDNGVTDGIPSCPFRSDIAIILGGRMLLLACDDCGTVWDERTGGYIHISEAEREILEKLFTSRGGTFPCI